MSKHKRGNLFPQLINKPLLLTQTADFVLLNEALKKSGNMPLQFDEQLETKAYSHQVRNQNKSYSQIGEIAVINITGELTCKHSWWLSSYEEIGHQIDDAMDDDSVSGILLNFDSPGGVVNGAFDLADKIRHARETKAIWAIADEQAYSAAYLLASQASKLFVPRTGGVGSIGVITIHFDYSQYFQNEGISPTVLRAGEQKARGNPYEPLSDAFKANKINELEELRKLFANTVSIGRGSISSDEILKTEAACFTADEALKMGLVDEVACFDEVLGKFVQHINNSEKGKVLMSEKDFEKEEKVEASTQVSASSEKERIKAILSSEEAKGREKLANHIAFDTGMGIDEAKSMLCNAPQASEKPKLDTVMSGYDSSIGDGGSAIKEEEQEPDICVSDIYNARGTQFLAS